MAHWISKSRIAIEQIRLLTLKAAHSIDTLGSASARKEVSYSPYSNPCITSLRVFSSISYPLAVSGFMPPRIALRIQEVSTWFLFKDCECLSLTGFPFGGLPEGMIFRMQNALIVKQRPQGLGKSSAFYIPGIDGAHCIIPASFVSSVSSISLHSASG